MRPHPAAHHKIKKGKNMKYTAPQMVSISKPVVNTFPVGSGKK